MSVIMKEGGPYSLFCTECKTWTPNTANAEMKKEGYIAYSHICKHLGPFEIPDAKWKAEQKKQQ